MSGLELCQRCQHNPCNCWSWQPYAGPVAAQGGNMSDTNCAGCGHKRWHHHAGGKCYWTAGCDCLVFAYPVSAPTTPPPTWGKVYGQLGDSRITAACGCRVWCYSTGGKEGSPCPVHSFADLVEGERRLRASLTEQPNRGRHHD